MTIPAILAPVFVQVFLTLGLLLWTATLRSSALLGGRVRPADIALRQPGWPERATQVANAFSNQVELPVLFYVLVAFALITRKADLLFVVLAWLFVLTRLVHAFIHTTGNDVRLRGLVFGAGALVLIVMWVVFAARILLGL